jgi:transposase InsO family protein
VKIEALSTKTGIDWNLQAGGAIVRILRDEPDVTSYSSSGQEGVMPDYNNDRIKQKLNGLSPVQYRTQAA